jgi:hypothetical protein
MTEGGQKAEGGQCSETACYRGLYFGHNAAAATLAFAFAFFAVALGQTTSWYVLRFRRGIYYCDSDAGLLLWLLAVSLLGLNRVRVYTWHSSQARFRPCGLFR